MSRSVARPHRALMRAAVAAVSGVLAVGTLSIVTGSADPALGDVAASVRATSAAAKKDVTPNVVTPGNFTGYGFDQCLAPDQAKMDRWLESSPFLAVGIYISGDSRACRDQPNLTPGWIRTQLRNGWRLLPITLGPQASCQPRFPRYGNDETIKPKPGKSRTYQKARAQGRDEAASAVTAAQKLGISAGSTLWYDLEGFDSRNTRCRESALAFLSGWTTQIRALELSLRRLLQRRFGDPGARQRPGQPTRGVFAMPDQIWVARWDGMANTSTSYLRDGRLAPARSGQAVPGRARRDLGRRHHQHRPQLPRRRPRFGRGSRDALRRGEDRLRHLREAGAAGAGDKPSAAKVKALKCLLQEQGVYTGKITGAYNTATIAAVNAWQTQRGVKVRPKWTPKNWMSLLSAGDQPVVKYGSAGPAVRRLQRTLNAAGATTKPLMATGVFDAATTTALKTWQKRARVEISGVAGSADLARPQRRAPLSSCAERLAPGGRTDQQREARQGRDRDQTGERATHRVAQQPGHDPVQDRLRRLGGEPPGRGEHAALLSRPVGEHREERRHRGEQREDGPGPRPALVDRDDHGGEAVGDEDHAVHHAEDAYAEVGDAGST